MYTLAWDAEIEGHLFDVPIIYTDPNASDFDESHSQGPDTVTDPPSNFHYSSDCQNHENCPTSYSSIVHPSKPKSQGQRQDVETATDLRYNDNSTQASESNTDIETAYEPMQQRPSRRSDYLSTIGISDPENNKENDPSHPRGGKNNLRPNTHSHYSKTYRY